MSIQFPQLDYRKVAMKISSILDFKHVCMLYNCIHCYSKYVNLIFISIVSCILDYCLFYNIGFFIYAFTIFVNCKHTQFILSLIDK